MRAGTARLSPKSWLSVGILAAAELLHAQLIVGGRVVDENGAPVSGARVEFQAPASHEPPWAMTDTQGRFRLELPASGDWLIRTVRPGFFVLQQKVAVPDSGADVVITVAHLQEFAESVDVVYSPPVIDPAETTDQKQLNTMQILEAPYPAPQDFRNALPLFPGVLQDARGRLHFNGGASEQTSFSLEGFNIADPVTGLLETRLSIDAVRTLELESSRFAVDKGRGSSAALDIKTGMGDDRWRFGATNFIPGVSTERGWILSKWTPRITVSGPLARGRAWFHNGFDTFYDVDTIRELPPGKDRNRSLTASNLTRFQVNLTPANILTAGFLVNYADSDHFGLSFLDPVETTLHRRQNFAMAMARHQAYFGRGLLLELGFAYSRGVLRQNPQGQLTYEFSPDGRRGNYFVDLTRISDRRQWTASAILPSWHARGQHQIKAGLNLERVGFGQDVFRHDYRVLRSDGSTARYVYFSGDGKLGKTNFETALYGHDRWSVRDDLLVELGVRFDWDQIVRDLLVSPRLSAAWSPRWLKDAKIAAGAGVFNDAFALGTLTRHQDQLSVATFYSRGGAPVRGPVTTGFLVNEQSLQSPRARLWSLTLERKLPFGLHAEASYLRRSGWKGFIFVEPRGEAASSTPILYSLANQRSDRYNALEFTLRSTFRGQFEWMASYIYSRSRSNAIIDYSLENPVYAPQAPGPVDWDAPHRLLAWGWAPVPKRILPKRLQFLIRETSLQYLLESRSGFPFSVVNEEGFLVGRPNERRFPYYFNINLHLERRFRFFRYLWAWRFGFNNLTNHGNPNVVNNNIDSPDFLAYGRGQHRAFNVRLRLLGRR